MLQNPQLHYLDNAATTIVAPEVADIIDKAMREHWANPSSLYGPGARSEEALNAARAAVARRTRRTRSPPVDKESSMYSIVKSRLDWFRLKTPSHKIC